MNNLQRIISMVLATSVIALSSASLGISWYRISKKLADIQNEIDRNQFFVSDVSLFMSHQHRDNCLSKGGKYFDHVKYVSHVCEKEGKRYYIKNAVWTYQANIELK